MTGLIEIYEAYYEKAAEVRRKAPPLAGLWGLGDDPRKHPCHDAFYEAVQAWVKEFIASGPDPAQTLAVVQHILGEAKLHENNKDVYWYLFAAHGLTMELIPMLRAEDCGELFAWYNTTYPRRTRFPVQEQVWKLLKKRAK